MSAPVLTLGGLHGHAVTCLRSLRVQRHVPSGFLNSSPFFSFESTSFVHLPITTDSCMCLRCLESELYKFSTRDTIENSFLIKPADTTSGGDKGLAYLYLTMLHAQHAGFAAITLRSSSK